ncbi:MAG: cysteine--tRNA ligase [Candidatus Omnitrophica bacterium]|nr:cysteine--tRNA ligase [Candidatus Omnitrophota bacterium]
MIQLYDTYEGRKREFKPVERGVVRMYTCGPTVYDYAHIGNFRAYIFEDLLRRFLERSAYRVIQVMNITDVDDKTITGAAKEGVSLRDYTDKYVQAFFEDLKTLNIEPAEHYPRATDYIPDMLKLVRALKDKGFTYETEGSVYFRVASFPKYGALSKKKLEFNISGARVDNDEYEKEQWVDFVLWKKKKEGEPSWPSEFGDGRPGWHIECSAMSTKLLGETLDIHTGGEDNIFPHHENEIAQSEAASGRKFVNYWLHCRFLLVEGEKMAKSKGNFFTLRDLVKDGWDPMAVRYLLISHNYRQPLNFTKEGLKQAENTLKRFDDLASRIMSYKPEGVKDKLAASCKACREKWERALADDLNIAEALAALFDWMNEANAVLDRTDVSTAGIKAAKEFLRDIDSVLGLKIYDEIEPSEEIIDKINERTKARSAKDFAKSDCLRKEILEAGWALKDGSPGEPSLYKRRKRKWDEL